MSSEFGRRAADDELCAAVAKAVADGDSDALRRLGLDGWGDYVQRLSELMNESVRDGLEQSDDFGALMSQVASPARYAHHLVTESGTAVQKAKDKPLGIHIKPLEPEFDDDALKGTVGTAANMDDPERAVETLADGLAYAVKKAGNEFVEKNAEQRSRAGFEVSVKRSGSSKCCPWCAARIGSWSLKNAPDGVFGCHAKCSCTVEYTSSTGAKTSASGANLHRFGAGAFTEIEYQPPHVLSREEAREKGGFDEPKRLTGAANGGIINDEQRSKVVTIWDKIKSFFGATPLPPDITDEEILQALSDIGFARIDNSFFTRVNRDLRLSVVDQLKILEDRFHAIENSISPTIAADRTGGAVASVSCPIDTPAQQKLHLSSTKYRNQKSHVKARKEDVDSFFCMPCKTDKETLSRYVITHEYGHMVENILSQQDMNGTIRTHRQNCERYKREILDIARFLDKNFDEDKCLSEYGTHNDNEFFAECFANSQLGKPNTLGEAMSIWLERRGY